MKQITKVKIYKCRVCGNVILLLEDSGATPVCCGADMELLKAKTDDAGHEKHVPVMSRDSCSVHVTVGAAPHPMTQEHYIKWILLRTTAGYCIRYLEPDTEPCAEFRLCSGEEPVSVYAYCNMHGLWEKSCC